MHYSNDTIVNTLLSVTKDILTGKDTGRLRAFFALSKKGDTYYDDETGMNYVRGEELVTTFDPFTTSDTNINPGGTIKVAKQADGIERVGVVPNLSHYRHHKVEGSFTLTEPELIKQAEEAVEAGEFKHAGQPYGPAYIWSRAMEEAARILTRRAYYASAEELLSLVRNDPRWRSKV